MPNATAAPLRVSIVIPCYNQSRYLAQAIDSVLAQDYGELELIVVDDGSTDASREVLNKFRGRCTIISQDNAGQASAVNRGWALAGGEFLGYLAADDYLLAGAVRRAVECLEQNRDAVLCYCDYLLVDPSSRTIRRVSTPEYSYRDLAVRLVCAPGPGVFLRRGAYERAGPWNERLRQIPDFELWLRLAREGRFCRIPEVLAAYRVHDASQSFAPVSAERATEMLQVVQEYFRTGCARQEIQKAKDEALSNAHVLSARLHLRSGRFAKAVGLLWAALKLFPANFLRVRTARLIVDGLLNRFAHRALWTIRR